MIEDTDKISFAYDRPIERCRLLPSLRVGFNIV